MRSLPAGCGHSCDRARTNRGACWVRGVLKNNPLDIVGGSMYQFLSRKLRILCRLGNDEYTSARLSINNSIQTYSLQLCQSSTITIPCGAHSPTRNGLLELWPALDPETTTPRLVSKARKITFFERSDSFHNALNKCVYEICIVLHS